MIDGIVRRAWRRMVVVAAIVGCVVVCVSAAVLVGPCYRARQDALAMSQVSYVAHGISRAIDACYRDEGHYPKETEAIKDTVRSRREFGTAKPEWYDVLETLAYSSDENDYQMGFEINCGGKTYYWQESGSKGRVTKMDYGPKKGEKGRRDGGAQRAAAWGRPYEACRGVRICAE
ncbi:MAG: hypothetical protein IH624_11995 [Phycisphaerae bacterium]|nr:hypothetical protein [Phycisphaerae bacterium]